MNDIIFTSFGVVDLGSKPVSHWFSRLALWAGVRLRLILRSNMSLSLNPRAQNLGSMGSRGFEPIYPEITEMFWSLLLMCGKLQWRVVR